MVIGSYISIIALNANELNAPTKRHRLAECIPKQDPYIYCLLEIHLKPRDMNKLKVRDWKKIFHANRDQKKEVIATLIPDKIDFKIKNVRRDKEGHYIMIRGIIQEDIMMINTYALNTRAPQNIRQMLTKSNTIIVGDFNIPLTPMKRSSRQKINK